LLQNHPNASKSSKELKEKCLQKKFEKSIKSKQNMLKVAIGVQRFGDHFKNAEDSVQNSEQ
jgi:hypothetical protein